MSNLFYKLPQKLTARRDILASDKLVLAVILDHLGRNKKCWPGKRIIMDKTGLASKTVCDAIKRLESAGFLSVDRRGRGKSNHYKSGSENELVQNLDRFSECTTGGSEIEPEVVQPLNPNQTDLIKTHIGDTFTFTYVLKDGKTWHLPQAKVNEYEQTYTEIDVESELKRAAQWLIDNPAKRKTASGMPRFLNGWLGRTKPLQQKTQAPKSNVWDAEAEERFWNNFIEKNAPTEEEAERLFREVGL